MFLPSENNELKQELHYHFIPYIYILLMKNFNEIITLEKKSNSHMCFIKKKLNHKNTLSKGKYFIYLEEDFSLFIISRFL